MSAAAIIGFIATIFYVTFSILFAVFAGKTVLAKDPGLFYGLGSVLLALTFLLELALLFLKTHPTWEVRLSALDITVVVGTLVLMIAIVRQQQLFSGARWKALPQIFLYLAWVFMLFNLIANLWIFFGVSCDPCVVIA